MYNIVMLGLYLPKAIAGVPIAEKRGPVVELVEVLVALLILTIGILGFAALDAIALTHLRDADAMQRHREKDGLQAAASHGTHRHVHTD